MSTPHTTIIRQYIFIHSFIHSSFLSFPFHLFTSCLAQAQQEDEEDLDAISELLGTVKGQAMDINKELNRQNKVLGYLEEETAKTDGRIEKNIKKIKGLK